MDTFYRIPVRLFTEVKSRFWFTKRNSKLMFIDIDYNPAENEQDFLIFMRDQLMHWEDVGFVNFRQEDGSIKLLPLERIVDLDIEFQNTVLIKIHSQPEDIKEPSKNNVIQVDFKHGSVAQ